MQVQRLAVNRRIRIERLQPGALQAARAANQAMDGVPAFQKKLGQVRPVLAGDSGDERREHGTVRVTRD